MTEFWQHIATAPKDGSKFLCYEEDGNISTVWWDKDRLGGRGWSFAEWQFPTHWRPMLKTPEQESKALHFDLTSKEGMDAAVRMIADLLLNRKPNE